MQYNTLLTRIAADIYSNGAELITGDILQNVLNDMVGALASAGACYKGTITPASAAPLDLDQPTVYLALTAGTYTNFVDSNNDPIVTTGPALITYDGGASLVFSKTDLPFATTGDLSNYLELDGGTMGGAIDMDGYAIQNVPDPVNNGDAANKDYVDNKQPWKVTIEPGDDRLYILIRLGEPRHNCILAIDSAGGAGALHGILCIDENFDITGAVFAGSGGLDTTVDAKSGYDDNSPRNFIAVLKFSNDQPVTLTCIGGNAPQLAVAFDALSGETFTSTRAWTNLEAGGGNIVTSWQDPPLDTNVPSEKLVFDSCFKKGVISQTQTWSGSGSNPRTYVMSGQVTGLIPQSFIDMAVSAGATFNPNGYQTGVGYFELNGLTDISYEEMKAIYGWCTGVTFQYAFRYAHSTIRTNLPDAWFGKEKPNNVLFAVSTNSFFINNAFAYSDIEAGLLPPADGSTTNYIKPTNSNNLVRESHKIKKLINPIDVSDRTSIPLDMFYNAFSLEEIQLYGLKCDISLEKCPRLKPSALVYIINNEISTGTITIKLHTTAYNAAIADADVNTALSNHPNVQLSHP